LVDKLDCTQDTAYGRINLREQEANGTKCE